MKTILKFFVVIVTLIFANSAALAKDIYPDTLNNGNLILVDGGMGVGRYADKDSTYVLQYAPPFYQIRIDIYSVTFSNDYYKDNGTYIGGSYTFGESYPLYLKYNLDSRTVFYQNNGIWKVWDLNRNYSHAEGNPLIPNSAEVAFYAAYRMKFFGNKLNGDGYPVVSDGLHSALGI